MSRQSSRSKRDTLKVKEMISLLAAECPEHLRCTRSIHFEGVRDQDLLFDSIEVYQLIRDNHEVCNGYFESFSRIDYASHMFWMMLVSYESWRRRFSGEITNNSIVIVEMGLLYLLMQTSVTNSLNNEVGLIVFLVSFAKS